MPQPHGVEPPNQSALYWPPRTGDEYPVLLVRDDATAALHGDPGRRWLVPNSHLLERYSWAELQEMGRGEGYDLAEALLLLPPAEVDAAVARAQITPVGEHLREPSGWCRTCGVPHSETEWARIHDREQQRQEARRG